MSEYVFVYRAPWIRNWGRVRLRWRTLTESFSSTSDRGAVRKAQGILRKSHIQFTGAYSIGTAVSLLAANRSRDIFRPLRSTSLGLR